MLYVGIDPGVSGGIAVLDKHGSCWGILKMPETDRDILDHFRNVAAFGAKTGLRVFAGIERVWTSPLMGVVSAGTFIGNVRALKMALLAAGIPFDEVLPAKWQNFMGCLAPRGTAYGSKDKNITKRRAQALFPDITVTHAVADALLLAEFLRRTHVDGVPPTPAKTEDGHGKATRTEKGKGTRSRQEQEGGAEGQGKEGGQGQATAAQTAAGTPGHGARPVRRAR